VTNRQQFLENLDSGPTILAPSAAVTTIGNAGTIFPLLAGNALRIYNASAFLFSLDATPGAQVHAINIGLLFFASPNATPGSQIVDQFGQNIFLILASAGWGSGAIAGGGGYACANEGDPLTEIRANSMVGGIAKVVQAVQLASYADVSNPDAVNPHTVFQQGLALIDFQI
jgi:hypothetical protein